MNRTTSGGLYNKVAECLIVGSLLFSINSFGLGTGSFTLTKWLSVIGIGLVATFFTLSKIDRRELLRLGYLELSLLMLLGYIAISVFWSPDWKAGVLTAVVSIGLAGCFLFFRNASPRTVFQILPATLMISIVLSLAVTMYEPRLFGGYGNENFYTEALLLSLPLCFLWGAGQRHGLKLLPVLIAVSVIAYLLTANGSRLELLLLPCLVFAYLFINWKTRVVAGSFSVILVLVCSAYFWVAFSGDNVSNSVLNSVRPRVELAINTLIMWLDSPVWGHGAGSFLHEYSLYKEAHLSLFPAFKRTILDQVYFSAEHAHNEYVQFLAEFGIVGAGIAVCLVWQVGKCLHLNRRRTGVQYLVLGWFLLAFLSFVDFPLHKPATACLAFTLLGLTRNPCFCPTAAEDDVVVFRPNGMLIQAGRVLSAVAIVGFAYFGFNAALANRYYNAVVDIGRSNPRLAFERNLHAVEYFSFSPVYRRQLFISLVKWIEKDRVANVSQQMAEQAYETSLSAAPYETSLLLARFSYLDRYKKAGPQELADLVATMLETNSLVPLVHLLDAGVAARRNEWKDVEKKLETVARMRKLNSQEVRIKRQLEAALAAAGR